MQLSNSLSKTVSVNVMVSCVKTFTNGFVPWEAGVRRRKKEKFYPRSQNACQVLNVGGGRIIIKVERKLAVWFKHKVKIKQKGRLCVDGLRLDHL